MQSAFALAGFRDCHVYDSFRELLMTALNV